MTSPPQQPAQDEAADDARPDPPLRRSRWRWAGMAALLAVLCHVPILRLIGDTFTVDDDVGHAEAAVILGGDHRHDVVANLYRDGQIDRVWLVAGRPNYLVTSGILPSRMETARSALANAGVPAERLEIIGRDVNDIGDVARVVKSTLQQHPQTDVIIVCPALGGRHVRIVFDAVLGDDLAERIHILGLPYDDFDVQRWWRSRTGLKQVFNQMCGIGFTWAMGTGPREADAPYDPDVFEQRLRAQFGEAACHEF